MISSCVAREQYIYIDMYPVINKMEFWGEVGDHGGYCGLVCYHYKERLVYRYSASLKYALDIKTYIYKHIYMAQLQAGSKCGITA